MIKVVGYGQVTRPQTAMDELSLKRNALELIVSATRLLKEKLKMTYWSAIVAM